VRAFRRCTKDAEDGVDRRSVGVAQHARDDVAQDVVRERAQDRHPWFPVSGTVTSFCVCRFQARIFSLGFFCARFGTELKKKSLFFVTAGLEPATPGA
jgi:hypothetical protein